MANEKLAADFHSYIAPATRMREFTARGVVLGTILGMIFGASSLYLVLKVGLTVSASIPVAVISITIFRLASKLGSVGVGQTIGLVRAGDWQLAVAAGVFSQFNMQSRTNDLINFMKNLALMGSALMLVAIPEPWPYSVAARRRIFA